MPRDRQINENWGAFRVTNSADAIRLITAFFFPEVHYVVRKHCVCGSVLEFFQPRFILKHYKTDIVIINDDRFTIKSMSYCFNYIYSSVLTAELCSNQARVEMIVICV